VKAVSSHREAPTISKDPVADNTDLYAFVDPVDTSKVTILSNFIPLEEPAGGPNFFQFGDDVLYEILIDNNGDGVEDVTYQFRFRNLTQNPATFLYNTGPIGSLTDPNWNMRQLYSVTKVLGPRRTGASMLLGSDIPTPPVRIGPRSTPGYDGLASAAVTDLGNGVTVFAGQRGEGFYVDLGSIFDLGALRPFQNLHLIPTPAADGKDGTKGFNVHTIAIRVPKTDLTQGGFNPGPGDVLDARSTIGVWSAASRRKATVREKDGRTVQTGPWVQVSRLGEPLINEVVIELGEKDFWNSAAPVGDSQFLEDYAHPQLQGLLPVLYPGVFPNLAGLAASGASRADLVAILLTGIPPGIIPGFANTNGPTLADELRLNVAIAPSYAPGDINPDGSSAKRFGLLGGDADGFPNGRRVFDNITAVELRAIAGVTYPLVAPGFVPDGAAGLLTDGTKEDLPFLTSFPYLATPYEGYEHSHD